MPQQPAIGSDVSALMAQPSIPAIGADVSSLMQQTPSAPDTSQGKGMWGAWGDMATDFVKGAAKNLAREGIRGGAMLRKIPGVNAIDRVIPPVQVDITPHNTAQRAGGIAEQVAEVVAPSKAITALSTKAATNLAPRLSATIGERLAYAAPKIGVEAAGSAAIAAAQGGNPMVGGAVGAVAPALGSAMQAVPQALREGAERRVVQALGPTKEYFKAMAQKIAPDVLKRGLWGSREALATQAANSAETAGQAIDEAIQQFGARQVSSAPVLDALESAKDAFRQIRRLSPADAVKEGFATSGPGGRLMMRKGAVLADDGAVELPVVFEPRGLKQVEQLQGIVRDLGPEPRVDQLIAVRRAWDKVVAQAGGFAHRAPGGIGMPLKDMTEAAVKRDATTAIRQLLNQEVPELTALNKEFTFWKSLDDVLTQTMKRTQPHGTGLIAETKEAAGQVAGAAIKGGGISSAFALGKVAKLAHVVFTSPRWRTIDAQMRDALANAIATNNLGQITTLLGRISAVEGSKVLAGSNP